MASWAARHTAMVTGANHGIGAATAVALGQRGCSVLRTFLRIENPVDPGVPQSYRDQHAQDARAVVGQIVGEGGQVLAIEADLSDPVTPAVLFDAAEQHLGPVDILVDNATGWVKDTFAPKDRDRLGRALRPVSVATWHQQFTVDAMAPAPMITEFARRHIARGATWGRIIGLTSGARQTSSGRHRPWLLGSAYRVPPGVHRLRCVLGAGLMAPARSVAYSPGW